MKPNEVADVLDKAHDELLVRGWNQGGFESTDGRVCVLGALGRTVGYTGPQVPDWNDEPRRTADEVFDALKNTAKSLREEAGQ